MNPHSPSEPPTNRIGRGDRAEGDRLALADGDRFARIIELLAGLPPDLLLDVADDPVGLLVVAVDEQPARALGHMPPHEQDPDAEHGADQECDAPPDVGREDRRVEQDQRAERAARRPEPVRAVDDQVHPAAHSRGDQLVDRRVDRRVLAADPGAGEEARDVEVQRRPRERGRHGGDEVQHQRDQEQLLAPEAIGELAEEQRADARAGDIDRTRGEDLARAQRQPAVVLLQPRRDRADDRDLEPVEDPHRPQPDDDQPVEPRPRQPVEPRRHSRLDRPKLGSVARHCAPLPGCRCRRTWPGLTIDRSRTSSEGGRAVRRRARPARRP
jgi:hypothetical protein